MNGLEMAVANLLRITSKPTHKKNYHSLKIVMDGTESKCNPRFYLCTNNYLYTIAKIYAPL
jgi:hypothetical protein